MAYTTTDKVSAFLGETLSATTTPTSAQVEEFITRAEQEINYETGTNYTEETTTNELYDYDKHTVFHKEPQLYQIGRVDHIYAPIKNVFKLNNYPIISVTKLEVNRGTTQTADWKTLTEGTDFIVYKDEGTIALIRTDALPVEDWQSIRISYTHGHTTVPAIIERLATLMVAKEVIRAKQVTSSYTSIDSISIESISITKSTRESVELLRSIQDEIDLLMTKIGSINQWII